MDELIATASTLKDLGIIGALLMFIIGLQRGWWVTQREHEALKADRDIWRNMGLQGNKALRNALKLAGARQKTLVPSADTAPTSNDRLIHTKRKKP